ncbi:unnamed protein product [Rotaria sp. Silwood2]|nr:unnamed protein product [Rotaria sp. Silwood2]CAF2638630.1 unnamed protein product [Rotaria sp. Silwood2]CAF3993726.1 unnamed protein product [Rotaria sp. Silwood2]
MILAIYIERINPGEFCISQPWSYLCKKGYWKSRRVSSVKQHEIDKNKDKTDLTVENNRWIESSSLANTRLPVLSTNHVTKKFGKLNAVMDLSLDFYNGEVCSLLGHNGAGKTTTTFILVDSYNRRLIWTIIRKMKEAGKCIIMTTHFLEEADVLSDRIAVMTKGRLQANGTPEFLKQQTDFEYRIFIDKNENCDIQHITQFFQEHVQTAVLERQSPSELVFGIKRGTSQRISRLINALDEQGSNIGIKGYGLSMTTVEEIGSIAHSNPEVEVHIYQGTEQISYFFLLYVMYSLASLPFMYSYSFISESELIGFIMFLILNMAACCFDMVLDFIAVFSQASPSSSPDKMGTAAQIMLILRFILAGFFPTVNFKQSLFNIHLRSDATCISAINSIMITNYSPDEPWTSANEPGIGLQLVIFSAQIVF